MAKSIAFRIEKNTLLSWLENPPQSFAGLFFSFGTEGGGERGKFTVVKAVHTPTSPLASSDESSQDRETDDTEQSYLAKFLHLTPHGEAKVVADESGVEIIEYDKTFGKPTKPSDYKLPPNKTIRDLITEGASSIPDFVYFPTEALVMLSEADGYLYLSGCKVSFDKSWKSKTKGGKDAFTLKIEGNRTKKAVPDYAYDIAAGYPCPPKWIKE